LSAGPLILLVIGPLERDQVFSCRTFLPVDHIEFDPCAFGQAFEAFALDGGVMTEYVLLTVVTRYEAEAFFVIEPFY
jgi:hypothetical protein